MKNSPTIGKLIDKTECRDAIHIAIAPMIAGDDLKPGEHVGLVTNDKASPYIEEKIGIADSFLTKSVTEGQRFWLFFIS